MRGCAVIAITNKDSEMAHSELQKRGRWYWHIPLVYQADFMPNTLFFPPYSHIKECISFAFERMYNFSYSFLEFIDLCSVYASGLCSEDIGCDWGPSGDKSLAPRLLSVPILVKLTSIISLISGIWVFFLPSLHNLPLTTRTIKFLVTYPLSLQPSIFASWLQRGEKKKGNCQWDGKSPPVEVMWLQGCSQGLVFPRRESITILLADWKARYLLIINASLV